MKPQKESLNTIVQVNLVQTTQVSREHESLRMVLSTLILCGIVAMYILGAALKLGLFKSDRPQPPLPLSALYENWHSKMCAVLKEICIISNVHLIS